MSNLTVYINSFSYKNGIPRDESEHGGGFVFDCRGIHNPGRFEEYKNYNGNDVAVANFLETKTRMPEFLKHVFSLVEISIEDYMNRDFQQLTINFGCTGGQHRSVYAAEKLADHLKKYPLTIKLEHKEKENWKNNPKKQS